MKFVCTRENLIHALDIVSPLAGKHAHLPILLNVLIQVNEAKVEFVTTNLEVALRVQTRAKVDAVGSFTVPAKTLLEYAHLLTQEQVELELQSNELLLNCGNSSTKIKGIPADEYPVIPGVEEEHAYVLEVGAFREALSKTVIAVAKNEIRPELSGVYFCFLNDRYNGLTLVATDSYRLAETRVSLLQGKDRDLSCIVPARVVYEIIRLLTNVKDSGGERNVRLWVSSNQIAFRYDTFEMTARLIEGKYPDYAQIIPNDFKTTVHVSVDALVNKIKAASLFTTVGVNAVSFDLNVTEHTLGVSSASTQTGEHSSELEAEVSGEENSILLNHRYVLDGLQHINDRELVFQVNNPDAPCLFKPKNQIDYLYMVMPIRQ